LREYAVEDDIAKVFRGECVKRCRAITGRRGWRNDKRGRLYGRDLEKREDYENIFLDNTYGQTILSSSIAGGGVFSPSGQLRRTLGNVKISSFV
jgi:hypothetical protein